jgi:hypothetical protein
MSYGLHCRGVISGIDKFFSSPQRPDSVWDLPSLLFNDYKGTLLLGVKRPGRDALRSSASSAEFKIDGDISPLPLTSGYKQHFLSANL